MAKKTNVAKPEDLAGGVWYVAVGSGTWGRGRDPEAALWQNVKAGGDRKTYLVYRVNVEPGKPGPSVDGSGSIAYHRHPEDPPDQSTMKLVAAMKRGAVVDPDQIV